MRGRDKTKKIRLLYILAIACSILLSALGAKAQLTTDVAPADTVKWYQPAIDTAQVHLYDRTFGLTLFLQQKNIRQNYRSHKGQAPLSYQPNKGIDLGLGFVYRYVALSGTFNFIQDVPKETLKTKSIDFQSQILSKRMVSFVYAQYYKGFYSDISTLSPSPGHDVYIRPDMRLVNLGASTSFGLKKDLSFSGVVSPVQWQKRSGGTPVLSLDIFYSLSRGDSALIPNVVAQNYLYADMMRSRTWSVGAGAGYAYTLVFKKHFFLTGIANVKVPVNFTHRTDESGTISKEISTGINLGLWGRLGYNAERWNVALTATNSRTPLGGNFGDPVFIAHTGYLRLGYTRRFAIGPRTRKKLKTVDGLLDIPYKLIEKIIP